MHPKITIAVIGTVSLVCMVILCRLTHFVAFYRIPSDDMLPAYRQNEWVLVHKLNPIKYNDVIAYKASFQSGSPLIFQRIAGLSGDTIEINDGYLLRNHFIVDNIQNLMFTYYIRKDQLKTNLSLPKLTVPPKIKDDFIILNLSHHEFASLSYDFKLRRLNSWNSRCYGPIIIPKGYCFALGDNRDEAIDSRRMGVVLIKNIVGVVIK